MMFSCFQILIFFCLYLNLIDSKDLKSVLMIARHGSRNSAELNYYTPPLSTKGFYGDLDPLGHRQHYLLGKFFREKYGTFITQAFNASEIEIVSTNMNRTIVSMQSLLLGLYEKTEEQLSDNQFANSSNLLPPFIINVSSDLITKLGRSSILYDMNQFTIKNVNITSNDSIIYPELYCKRIIDMINKTTFSDGYSKIVMNEKSFFDNVLKILNIDPLKFYSQPALYQYLCDTLFVLDYTGRAPAEITPDIVKHSEEIHIQLFDYIYETYDEMHSLYTNMFRDELINVFNDKISNKSSRKMTLYLDHDSTIYNFLRLYNPGYKGIPSYASSLIFELYQNGLGSNPEDFEVAIYFNNELIIFPNGNPLSFLQFKSILEKNLSSKTDYIKKCNTILP